MIRHPDLAQLKKTGPNHNQSFFNLLKRGLRKTVRSIKPLMLGIVFLLLTVVCIYLFAKFLYLESQSKPGKGIIKNNQVQTPSPFPSPKVRYFQQSDLPEGEYFELNGVKLKNFYNEGLPIGSFGEVILAQETKYRVSYYPKDKGFLISVMGNPFDEYRRGAEQAFLKRLKISDTDACKLLVEILTPVKINPNEGGLVHHLSWCK